MDTFEEMYKAWKDAESNTENWGLTADHYQVVQAIAAIAQAEQLKRIADNLDLIVQEWGKPHYIVNPILK